MQNGQDIWKRLEWLKNFGQDSLGGTTRLLYSSEWVAAQTNLKDWIESLGLEAYFDEIGNLYGRVKGRREELVMTGSHVDTVRNGGAYDGQYGIIAGIMALADLKKRYGEPKYTLEVVSFAEEEGSRFPMTFWGSKSMLGLSKKEEAIKLYDAEGIAFADAIEKAGFSFKSHDSDVHGKIKAFVELHVEQGGVLERENIPIGIVQNIVGQRRFTINLTGEANHAGTTPMSYRKDALVASSAIIVGIHSLAHQFGDPMVATVGSLDVIPGVSNVVPGTVNFTIDARHVDSNALLDFTEKLKGLIEKKSSEFGVSYSIDMWMDVPPVPMDKGIVQMLKDQLTSESLPFKMMHSGAGHDSQVVASVAPTAMIFIPSKKGISHSPHEFTDPKELSYGLAALTTALYKLAY